MKKSLKKIPGLKILEAGALRIEAAEGSSLDVRAKGKRWRGVKIALCQPLTDPGNLGLMRSADGKELALIRGLRALDSASANALRLSLRLSTLTASIKSIQSLGHQYGAVYWKVETDRGPREFVLKSLSEQVRWLSDTRILMTDVDGNRFEIRDMSKLDKKSHALLDLVL
jgi:hypothetical protein